MIHLMNVEQITGYITANHLSKHTNAKQIISDIQKSKIMIADLWYSGYTYREKFFRWRTDIRKRILKIFHI